MSRGDEDGESAEGRGEGGEVGGMSPSGVGDALSCRRGLQRSTRRREQAKSIRSLP